MFGGLVAIVQGIEADTAQTRCHGTNTNSTFRNSILVAGSTTLDQAATITQDEFQALEQKVLRAVEIVRREREARAAAEAEAAELRAQLAEAREQLDAQTSASNATQSQIATLNQEREAVRLRVEKILQQMDELV